MFFKSDQQTERQHLSNVVSGDGVATNDVDEKVAERRQDVAVGLPQSAGVAHRRVVTAADAEVVEKRSVEIGASPLSR